MNNFLKRLMIFLLILLVLDRSFILFRRNEVNIFSEITRDKMKVIKPEFFSKEKFDILIFGSSHAQFAVSPEIISNTMHVSCLNVAHGDGANIGKQINLLRNIISQGDFKKPKVILFGMDVFAMNRPPVFDDQFQQILFEGKGGISSFFNSSMFNSYFKLYARFIPAYLSDVKHGKLNLPYFRSGNSYDFSMFTKFEKYEVSKLGWVRGYGFLNKSYLRYSKEVFRPDPESEKVLLEFISICRTNNIELVFFQIPEHAECLKYKKKYEDFDVFMKQVTQKNDLTYLNYNDSTAYPVANDSLFFDSDHLNIKGAELFTRKLVNDLKLHK